MSGFGWESSGGGGGSLPSGFLQVAGGVPLDGTLRTITDGVGNASPLQLSTTNVGMTFADTSGLFYGPYSTGGVYSGIWDNKLGTKDTSNVSFLLGNSETYVNGISGIYFSVNGPSATLAVLKSNGFGVGITTANPSARLQVRGDGTNPIARFEDNTGLPMLRIENSLMRFGASTPFGCLQFSMSGTTFSGENNGLGLGFYSQMSLAATTDRFDFGFGGEAVANTAGTVSHLALVRNFAAAAGSANFRPLNLAYTINNSGAQTGTATGIFLNATETALNGMGHNLMDLQVGGESRIKVDNAGRVFTGNSIIIQIGSSLSWSDRTVLNAPADGNLRITNSAGNNFGLLQLGGTTNAFPAIKRNGAAIDFRLADDSGYATITALYGVFDLVYNNTFSIGFAGGTTGIHLTSVGSTIFSATGATSVNASAQVQIDSTTKGFLPPRMTTTEVNAIAIPAEGLVVFNTTTSHLCVYQGGAWVKINHSPM